MSEEQTRSPEAMRQAMADYVTALHQAYADAASQLPPGERARLPLLDGTDLTVLAVGTRYLHLLATAEALPPPTGQEVEMTGSLPGLSWRLRFFDPVVLPALGLVDESDAPQPARVRDALGVRTSRYHLTVSPGGGLSAHHALHAGTGLAHSQAAAVRDLDAIAALLPSRIDLVDELRGATVAGLPRAQLLLARAIAPTDEALQEMSLASAEPDRVRRALLAAVRRSPS